MSRIKDKEAKSSRKSKTKPNSATDLQEDIPNIFSQLEKLGHNLLVEIQSIEDDGMTMEFDVVGTTPQVANAVRRVLLVEVPSMAPETVLLQQNNTAMQDEVLGHRLGLIPFRADPRKFKFRQPKARPESAEYALIFELKVTAPKQPLKSDKRFQSTKVFTKDFVWIRDPQAHAHVKDDLHLRPVSDDILVNVMRPGQEMDLRVHVVKGIGKDHIKFSPVSLASYRYLPIIRLVRDVVGEEAYEFQKSFSKGVIDVQTNNDGLPMASVINPRADTGSRNILRDPVLKNAVELGSVKDHFIFNIESVGALTVSSLVKEACKILKDRSCSEQWTMFAFARELGWPVFDNGMVRVSYMTNPLFPTAFGLAGSSDGVSASVFGILRDFGWYHVTVLSDAKATTAVYSLMVEAILKAAKLANKSAFRVEKLEYNGNDASTIQRTLLQAKLYSRVFVLVGATSMALKVLEQASLLDMGNGDYAFINPQIIQLEPYGKAASFDNPSPTMGNITRSLLYTTFHAYRSGFDEFNKNLRRLAKKLYNTTYVGIEPLDSYAIQATYNSVDVVAQAINASQYRDPRHPCDIVALVRSMANHTFTTDLGNTVITAEKVNLLDVDVYAFDTETAKMKLFALFNATTDEFTVVDNNTLPWIAASTPLDIPLCGFSGDQGPCNTNQKLVVVTAVPAVLIALAVAAAAWACRYLRSLLFQRSLWWLILERAVELATLPSLKTKEYGEDTVRNLATYNGHAAWITRLPITAQTLDKRRIARIIRAVPEHRNILTFYGLCISQRKMVLLLDAYHSRGSLLDLSSQILQDAEFKQSFVRDVIKGVQHLHNYVGPHGRLRPSRCLIDNHFVLKLAKFQHQKIRIHFSKRSAAEDFPRSVWTAPELTFKDVNLTTACDVYSLALLLKFIVNDAEFQTTTRTTDFDLLVNRGCSTDPMKRPTVAHIDKTLPKVWFEKTGDVFSRSDVVDRLHKKLLKYASHLETAAAERTAELRSERAKCDELLLQILPTYIVTSLRNGVTVHPMFYEGVSICFSQVANFSDRMHGRALSAVVDALAELSNIWDEVLARFEVTKIEAVGDCCMVASGVPNIAAGNEHAAAISRMALYHRAMVEKSGSALSAADFLWGINSGPCAAGVVGKKIPRYLLFGDTINMASRMMSHGEGGMIHVSQETALLLLGTPFIRCEKRGTVSIKGRGKMITYWLTSE